MEQKQQNFFKKLSLAFTLDEVDINPVFSFFLTQLQNVFLLLFFFKI